MLKNTNLFKVLFVIALAFALWIHPSSAQAQDVDCPATNEEYWELYLTHSEAEIREVAMQCMEGMEAEGAETAASTEESEAAQPIDERKQVDLEKGVVTLVPADYTCVGDVSLDGQKKYDSDGNTGMVVYLLEETPVTADFGTVTCWPGNISADADTQQRAEGCDADGCGNMQMMEWPEEVVAASTLAEGPIQIDSNADLGNIPEPVNVYQQGAWTVYEIELANDPIVAEWISRLQDPAPELWPTFPNVPNKLVPDFPAKPCEDNPEAMCVPAGVEYGMDNAPFCEQDKRCDWVVAAWSYALHTGDYVFQDMSCQNTDADARKGCLILLINVMDETYIWRNQSLDNGNRITGGYFDGDKLEWGTWGLVSHGSANMLNMRTYRNPLTGDVLNSGDGANSGRNCGIPEGCPYVDATVVIHAGDRILAVLKTTIMRPADRN